MIPTLFEKNTRTFTGNGIGRLTDAISCSVVEVRNGEYELTMEYPVSGIHYEDLELERIIFAEPSQKGKNQPFPIYKISRPINGIVTVNAAHISYWLNDIVVKPFTAASCASALAAIPTNALNDCPFTFRTDKQVAGNFNCEVPKAVRGMLGGEQGSILDVYGKGDYEFDNFEVILHTNRGTDNGVTIHYGKNLTDLVRDTDLSTVYTGIVPFWTGSDSSVSLNQVVYSDHRADFAHDIIKPVDMSEYWQEAPTLAQLRSRAQSYVRANEGWEVNDNIRISFVPLWETEEFKDVSLLEEVHLCDTVTIIYTALNVVAKTKVIRTEYDVLRERYISIELGSTRNSLGKVLMDDLKEEVDKNKTIAFNIVQHQGELLRGGLGGYMVINTDADGTPRELLFMNTPDRNTATKVLRINMNGIGFSDGYNANPNTAWTIDGKFNASYIQTGTCSANRVRTGTLESTGGAVKFDLDAGTLTMGNKALIITAGNLQIDANGNVTVSGTVTAGAGSKIGPWNVSASAITYNNGTYGSTGLYFGTSGISLGNKFKVSAAGVLECSGATISGAITATSLTLGNGVTVPYSSVSGTPDLTIYVAKDGTIGSTPSATTTGFKVSSQGLLTASNAVIYGTIYSSAGTIGGWNITGSSIQTNGASYGNSGMYFGTSGISLGNTFKVTSDGVLTCSGATVNGTLRSYNSDGTMYSTLANAGIAVYTNGVHRIGIAHNPSSGRSGLEIYDASGTKKSYVYNDGLRAPVGYFDNEVYILYNDSWVGVLDNINSHASRISTCESTLSSHHDYINQIIQINNEQTTVIQNNATAISNLQTAYDNLKNLVYQLHGLSDS